MTKKGVLIVLVIVLPVLFLGWFAMQKTRWNFKNFTIREMRCKCGKCSDDSGLNMNYSTMKRLQKLRDVCDFPFLITSAYRCNAHPEEARKVEPGTHNYGHAVDIQATPQQMDTIEQEARKLGFTGIGRANSFIHIDDYAGNARISRPAKWYYS